MNDVYWSDNGIDWKGGCHDAIFNSVHFATQFINKMWVVAGGTYSGARYSDVYTSEDGRHWSLVTNSADFGALIAVDSMCMTAKCGFLVDLMMPGMRIHLI